MNVFISVEQTLNNKTHCAKKFTYEQQAQSYAQLWQEVVSQTENQVSHSPQVPQDYRHSVNRRDPLMIRLLPAKFHQLALISL